MSKLTARPGKAGFHATMGHCNHSVIVGASPKTPNNKYIPIMGLVTADRAAWMYLNHFDTPMADHPEIVDGKIVFSSAAFKHEKYVFQDADGDKLKWNMHWPDGASVPKTIRFKLTSDGLDFHRILRPTQAEIETWPDGIGWNGFVCPESEDSFAIYRSDGKTGDIKFKDGTMLNRGTSKVGDIYSMFFTDEAGARSPLIRMELTPDIDKAKWLMLYIDDAQRPEIMEWLLDPARVGKITFDPIIGYNTVGGSQGPIAHNVYYTGPYAAASASGPIESIHLAYSGNTAPDGVKIGIANCQQFDPFRPDGFNLIAEASDVLIAASSSDHELANLIKYSDVVAGTFYMYGLVFEGNNITNIRFDFFGTQKVFTYNKIFPIEMQNFVPVTQLFNNSFLFSTWAGVGVPQIVKGTRSGQAQALGIKETFRAKGSGQARNISVKGRFK